MPHLPFLAIAALVVAVPTWLLAGQSSRVNTEFEFTGSPQDYVVPAGACQIRIEVVGAAGGPGGSAGAPGAGAQAVADFRVTPGEILRVRVGGWGGEAVGSTPGAGGWNGGGAGGETIDRGKAGSGGGGATDVRRGGDGLEHRIIVGAGGSGGAGGAIGGPIGTGGGNGGDLAGQRASPSSGRRTQRPAARAERRQREAPRVETLPISRSRRRPARSVWAATAPQGQPAAAVAAEADSTVAAAAVPAAPSAVATAAAARASAP